MFLRRRLTRCKTAVLVVMSLLFSQLALASYVCPSEGRPSAMAGMMVAGEPCRDAEAELPVLCHQHATERASLFEHGFVVALPFPAVVRILLVPKAIDASTALAVPRAATAEPRPPPDPLFLSTLRLRV